MLDNGIDVADASSRQTKTFKQLRSEDINAPLDEEKVLLEPEEFMKLIKYLYGAEIDRRTLQLYSSPRFKLLPPPVHKGGHISYYLNPEHTQRLAVILHLRDKLHLSLKAIRKVVENYPVEYYHLILCGVLAGEELLDFPALIKAGFNVKDVVFYKISEMLTVMDQRYWEMIGKEGRQAPLDIEKSVNRDLSRDLKDLAGWLRTECRMEIGDIIQDQRKRRHFKIEGAS